MLVKVEKCERFSCMSVCIALVFLAAHEARSNVAQPSRPFAKCCAAEVRLPTHSSCYLRSWALYCVVFRNSWLFALGPALSNGCGGISRKLAHLGVFFRMYCCTGSKFICRKGWKTLCSAFKTLPRQLTWGPVIPQDGETGGQCIQSRESGLRQAIKWADQANSQLAREASRCYSPRHASKTPSKPCMTKVSRSTEPSCTLYLR
jgi:hypothetical protein